MKKYFLTSAMMLAAMMTFANRPAPVAAVDKKSPAAADPFYFLKPVAHDDDTFVVIAKGEYMLYVLSNYCSVKDSAMHQAILRNLVSALSACSEEQIRQAYAEALGSCEEAFTAACRDIRTGKVSYL